MKIEMERKFKIYGNLFNGKVFECEVKEIEQYYLEFFRKPSDGIERRIRFIDRGTIKEQIIYNEKKRKGKKTEEKEIFLNKGAAEEILNNPKIYGNLVPVSKVKKQRITVPYKQYKAEFDVYGERWSKIPNLILAEVEFDDDTDYDNFNINDFDRTFGVTAVDVTAKKHYNNPNLAELLY